MIWNVSGKTASGLKKKHYKEVNVYPLKAKKTAITDLWSGYRCFYISAMRETNKIDRFVLRINDTDGIHRIPCPGSRIP